VPPQWYLRDLALTSDCWLVDRIAWKRHGAMLRLKAARRSFFRWMWLNRCNGARAGQRRTGVTRDRISEHYAMGCGGSTTDRHLKSGRMETACCPSHQPGQGRALGDHVGGRPELAKVGSICRDSSAGGPELKRDCFLDGGWLLVAGSDSRVQGSSKIIMGRRWSVELTCSR
jgi:hypothetical protein